MCAAGSLDSPSAEFEIRKFQESTTCPTHYLHHMSPILNTPLGQTVSREIATAMATTPKDFSARVRVFVGKASTDDLNDIFEAVQDMYPRRLTTGRVVWAQDGDGYDLCVRLKAEERSADPCWGIFEMEGVNVK